MEKLKPTNSKPPASPLSLNPLYNLPAVRWGSQLFFCRNTPIIP